MKERAGRHGLADFRVSRPELRITCVDRKQGEERAVENLPQGPAACCRQARLFEKIE